MRSMMAARRYEIILCRREPQQLTLEMLAARAGMHPKTGGTFCRAWAHRADRVGGDEVGFRCFGGSATAYDRTAARFSGDQPCGCRGGSQFARSILRFTAGE